MRRLSGMEETWGVQEGNQRGVARYIAGHASLATDWLPITDISQPACERTTWNSNSLVKQDKRHPQALRRTHALDTHLCCESKEGSDPQIPIYLVAEPNLLSAAVGGAAPDRLGHT